VDFSVKPCQELISAERSLFVLRTSFNSLSALALFFERKHQFTQSRCRLREFFRRRRQQPRLLVGR